MCFVISPALAAGALMEANTKDHRDVLRGGDDDVDYDIANSSAAVQSFTSFVQAFGMNDAGPRAFAVSQVEANPQLWTDETSRTWFGQSTHAGTGAFAVSFSHAGGSNNFSAAHFESGNGKPYSGGEWTIEQNWLSNMSLDQGGTSYCQRGHGGACHGFGVLFEKLTEAGPDKWKIAIGMFEDGQWVNDGKAYVIQKNTPVVHALPHTSLPAAPTGEAASFLTRPRAPAHSPNVRQLLKKAQSALEEIEQELEM